MRERPQLDCLKAFKRNPTVLTGRNLLSYLDKYPMSQVLMNDEDKRLREEAWKLVTGD